MLSPRPVFHRFDSLLLYLIGTEFGDFGLDFLFRIEYVFLFTESDLGAEDTMGTYSMGTGVLVSVEG